MIIVAMILAAAAPADALPKARQSYASCLSEYTNGAVDRKMPREEFVTGLKTKCAEKETAFRNALAAADKADGMNDQETAQDVNDQVSEYIEKMTSDFDGAQ